MDVLIFFYISIFPFGKLLGNISDLIVILISLYAFWSCRRFKVNKFILVCIFSLIFSLSFFKFTQLFTGILYLIRFVSYVFFAKVVYERFGRTEKRRKLIFNSLIISGIFIA